MEIKGLGHLAASIRMARSNSGSRHRLTGGSLGKEAMAVRFKSIKSELSSVDFSRVKDAITVAVAMLEDEKRSILVSPNPKAMMAKLIGLLDLKTAMTRKLGFLLSEVTTSINNPYRRAEEIGKLLRGSDLQLKTLAGLHVETGEALAEALHFSTLGKTPEIRGELLGIMLSHSLGDLSDRAIGLGGAMRQLPVIYQREKVPFASDCLMEQELTMIYTRAGGASDSLSRSHRPDAE